MDSWTLPHSTPTVYSTRLAALDARLLIGYSGYTVRDSECSLVYTTAGAPCWLVFALVCANMCLRWCTTTVVPDAQGRTRARADPSEVESITLLVTTYQYAAGLYSVCTRFLMESNVTER